MCPAFCVCSFSLIKPTKLLAHGSAKRRRLIRLQYQRTLRVHILPRTIDRRRRLQSALEGHRDRSVSIVHQTDRRLAFPKLPNVLVQDDPFRILSIGPQSGLPPLIVDLRTRVWSFVPLEIPATSQPLPGSGPLMSPITSITT